MRAPYYHIDDMGSVTNEFEKGHNKGEKKSIFNYLWLGLWLDEISLSAGTVTETDCFDFSLLRVLFQDIGV